MKRIWRPGAAMLMLTVLGTGMNAPGQFAFEKNEHVAIIGNALPDRMQHDGWLETYLQAANPDKQLVIRNLGFTGDQVGYRPRNKNFPDEHAYLGIVGADVILAFFGYNESFSRAPEAFKAELEHFITDAATRRYNGSSAPRIVLFSPIAHEDLGSPNLPDGEESNLWLSIYTDAMARVAQQHGLPFVDLFAISKDLYEEKKYPLTINGVHLNPEGNKLIARAIVEALGGKISEQYAELLRAAVLDKNWCWFNRYRATDGNDVWGTRSTLKFVNDQTNAEVLQHELVMLDIKSANRDKVIWSAAHGEKIAPNDSNVPNPILVASNYVPSVKNGELTYTSPEEGLASLTLAKGMRANIFASEVIFPGFVNPVQLGVDTKGRLWAAVWQTYPKWQPDRDMLDKLVILPDADRDGIADGMKTFAYVHNPTGFTFWNGGVIVISAPNILFLKDTDGDDVADFREILFSGIDSADTHHTANGLDYGPDGYIYYQRGIFNVSNVETPWQAAELSGKAAMYRFNPRTFRFSLHAENSPNPHGGDFDYWGYHYATDGTSGRAFQIRPETDGQFKMYPLLDKTVRPVPSSGILSSTHFPPELNGNYMILNCIGFLGIKQYKLDNKDGEMWGTETEDLLVSSDGNFRPSDFAFGGDGALYVADWSNSLIGHMQHNVRDPNRDHDHGRIYRITVDGRPLQEPVKIDGESIETVLDVLKHPTNSVRLRARVELSERDPDKVIAATQQWIRQFDPGKAEDAHPLLEALWLHEQFNVVNENLLTVLLNSPQPDARRAAETVKFMWEYEGVLGDGGGMAMDHTMHTQHRLSDEEDYLAQEMSPEPRMVGDTLEVHIHTLKEQMRYDRTEFIVGAGMKVRLVFYNPDAMDHNLIMVQPGAVEQVAMAALMLGADGVKQNWTPKNPNILFASKLLSIGESETMEFTAPKDPGKYEYLCTFPGHWQLMRGVMIVEGKLGENAQRIAMEAEEKAAGGDDFWSAFEEGADAAAPEVEAVKETAEPQHSRVAENITLPQGFGAELLYAVPETIQGSWVSLTKTDDGRLIASDEHDKGLYLISPAKLGDADATTEATKIDVPVSGAQGLCWVNGALYANVSDGDSGGLWRISDSDQNGVLDVARQIVPLRGSGEHGPHGVIPTEDGKGLYFMGGNNTRAPDFELSRAPAKWGDDLVLTRQWDDLGNLRAPLAGDQAPGGWIARCDLNGKHIELLSNGFRNPYDLAINTDGELFTFDGDTEWDLGLPWYRPARIYHVVSGGEYGWRPGTAKWPAYYEDSVAPVLDLGPATPSGAVFGTGAKFPAKYQQALFALDWRFGAIYAIHPRPHGASYTGTWEVFASGKPLAVTDAVVGNDGALYFTVGRRGVKSALYRITYTGPEDTAHAKGTGDEAEARQLRAKLEALHRGAGRDALDTAWPQLGSPDRAIRFAARVAVEKQPVEAWRERALNERNPRAAVTALMALARQGEGSDLEPIFEALYKVNFGEDLELGLSGLRTCALAVARLGMPEGELREDIVEALDENYPTQDAEVNVAVAELLTALQSPTVVAKTMALMKPVKESQLPAWADYLASGKRAELYGGSLNNMLRKPPPLEALRYAFILRGVSEGWTLVQRQDYFEMFKDAAKRGGGPRYGEYLTAMRAEAISACTQTERERLATYMDAPLLPAQPTAVTPPEGPGRTWTKAQALAVVDSGLTGRDYARGQNIFNAAACSLCHQFNGQGGVGGAIGPELSSVGNKYSVDDLLDAIITPSENVPDQYGSVIATTKSGKTVMGRPVEGIETVQVISQDPTAPVEVLNPGDVEKVKESPVSQMPPALINMLNEDELKDLVAYLLSSGNRNAPVYKR